MTQNKSSVIIANILTINLEEYNDSTYKKTKNYKQMGTDFWCYSVGVNVIPATNKHTNPNLQKKPFWTDSTGQ